MMSKIIITGGCGFIGSHTAVELIQNGYGVILVDDLSNASLDSIDRIENITGTKPDFSIIDLKDEESTDLFFKEHKGAVGVIHFAAHKAVGESVEEPLMYYENNLKTMIHVLKSMEIYGINNFIFSSSATVYGLPDELPLLENTPTQRPFSPYGNTKKIGEEILEDMVRSTDLKAISLRYFNPIGAHPSGFIGELPQGKPNNLMPYITQTAIGKQQQLQVFGNDYPTRDGTPIRDYIHVVDLAIAHSKAIDYLIDKKQSTFEIFNLGTGQGYTVMEIITSFEKVTGKKLNYKIVERREGDVPKLYANADKAITQLNWKATKGLEDMIADSWRWEQHYNNEILK